MTGIFRIYKSYPLSKHFRFSCGLAREARSHRAIRFKAPMHTCNHTNYRGLFTTIPGRRICTVHASTRLTLVLKGRAQ
jgi:hypothetical protein